MFHKKATPCCPSGDCFDVVKNGKTRHGTQNHKCRGGGRQFSGLHAVPKAVPTQTHWLNRLLLERLSMRAISRVLDMSLGSVYNKVTAILNPLVEAFELVQQAD